MSASTEIDRVQALVAPIAADLQLDVYDIERRGATMRVTLDTLPGSEGGVTLDSLSLATRLISRELDHEDPIAGHYTLEVTSPGLERQLRTPAHYTASDDTTATLMLDDGTERSIPITEIDKARTVFEWGPKPKPGKQTGAEKQAAKTSTHTTNKEKQPS